MAPTFFENYCSAIVLSGMAPATLLMALVPCSLTPRQLCMGTVVASMTGSPGPPSSTPGGGGRAGHSSHFYSAFSGTLLSRGTRCIHTAHKKCGDARGRLSNEWARKGWPLSALLAYRRHGGPPRPCASWQPLHVLLLPHAARGTHCCGSS